MKDRDGVADTSSPMPPLAALSAEQPLAGRKVLIIVENLPLPFDRSEEHTSELQSH